MGMLGDSKTSNLKFHKKSFHYLIFFGFVSRFEVCTNM